MLPLAGKEETGAEEVASSVHKSETEVKPNQIEDKGETVDIEESGAASPQVAEVPEKSGSALERLLKEQEKVMALLYLISEPTDIRDTPCPTLKNTELKKK